MALLTPLEDPDRALVCPLLAGDVLGDRVVAVCVFSMMDVLIFFLFEKYMEDGLDR